MPAPTRLAILISGRGSNMAALLAAAAAPGYPATVAVVLSNRPDAAGLATAAAAGVPAVVVDHRAHASKAAFEDAMTAVLEAHAVDIVCLAGFMRLLSARFIDRWMNRLVNIHPSLLPAYRGLDTHARAIADGVRIAGCTVHMVRMEMDTGPILAQAAVPVLPDDTADRLAARVLAAEHRLYPAAVAALASGRITLVGDKRLDLGQSASEPAAIFSPQLT